MGILELLAELAGERQVILFTQEERVRDWARRRIHDDRGLLCELL
jgi:hypothetical protein